VKKSKKGLHQSIFLREILLVNFSDDNGFIRRRKEEKGGGKGENVRGAQVLGVQNYEIAEQRIRYRNV